MKRVHKREEDPADQWLRKNDPYYTAMGRGKINALSHPYLTPDQEVARRRKEIPISQFEEADLDFLQINNQ